MKAKYFRFLIIFLVILIPIFIFGIINTMVGQTYEIQNPNECISIVTGIDLCKAIRNLKIYIAVDIILIIILFIFKNRIVKKNIV